MSITNENLLFQLLPKEFFDEAVFFSPVQTKFPISTAYNKVRIIFISQTDNANVPIDEGLLKIRVSVVSRQQKSTNLQVDILYEHLIDQKKNDESMVRDGARVHS